MKKRLLFIIMTVLIFFAACSSTEEEEEVTPHDRFDAYIELWNNQEFTKMYEHITEESSADYPTEAFIDRYEKIYEDLDLKNINISYTELSEEDLDEAMEIGEAVLPFTVEVDSIAGPITFDYEATLIKEEEINEEDEEEEDWFVHWDPGFIFPELKDGGEIKFNTTQPERGEILDRNQMPLAINDYVYEVGIIPDGLAENEDAQKEKIADLLKVSVESIDAKLNESWVESDLFVPIKKIHKTKEDVAKELRDIDAVMLREVTGRSYPAGEAAAHLIGYIGPITAEELENKDSDLYGPHDMIGKQGFEKYYDEELRGESGLEIVIAHEGKEDVVLAEKPVQDGENLSLTIDVNIQQKIFDSYDGETGSSTAINPKTGETLALVSSPAFDPNEALYGLPVGEWEKLQEDEKSPLLNRLSATFAPGSVMKPITAAIGLDNGTIDPDEGIEINGLTWSNEDGSGWGDYEVRRVSESDKPVDLADALMRSDNIYFAMQAIDMGVDPFIEGLEQFGFGEDIPFPYPIQKSTISSDGTLSGEVPLANTSYGQAEIEMSSLHLASIYTTFLNEGDMLKPLLFTDDEHGQIWHKDILSAENADLIEGILRQVVTDGTASTANDDALEISGKTGTAELKKSKDEDGEENGWFVGYPTEEQDILIAMLIENSKELGTSAYAAEKVKDILLDLQ